MAVHSTLTGVDLHECKGADSASLNTVRVADGAGSGAWQKITQSQVNTSSLFGTNQLVMNVAFVDVSTAETVYLVVPCGATLTKVYSVLQGTITVADSILTVKDHNGNTAGTFIVSYSGSAAGDIDSVSCSTNNIFTSGQRVSVTTDGGSTTAMRLFVTLVFTVTGAIS